MNMVEYAIAAVLALNLVVWAVLTRSNDEYVSGGRDLPSEEAIGQACTWREHS